MNCQFVSVKEIYNSSLEKSRVEIQVEMLGNTTLQLLTYLLKDKSNIKKCWRRCITTEFFLFADGSVKLG